MKKEFLLCLFTLSILIISPFSFADNEPKPIYVGVVWVGQSSEADIRYHGLAKELKQLAPQIKLEAKKEISPNKLSTLVRKWEKTKSAVIFVRSITVKWLTTHNTSLPVFITLCNNPVYLGVLENLTAPEKNITGTTYYVPILNQIQFFKTVLPEMNSILLLHETGHPSGIIDETETRNACKELNLQYYDAPCATKEDLSNAIKQYRGKVSAIIIGNHALGLDLAKHIATEARSTPVFSFLHRPVKYNGILAVYTSDPQVLDHKLAQSVVDVLVNHKPINSIPVQMDDHPKGTINMTVAKKLGIKIPYDVLDSVNTIE